MDPLVQVLIPTYERPEYLKIALDSVFSQTYSNYRILISDDSKTNRTEKMICEFFPHNPKIDYRRNPQFNDDSKPPYYAQNQNSLYLKQNIYDEADYVQWLMDDDIFYPEKFEKMVWAYENNPDVTLVSSFRHNIDENGRRIYNNAPMTDKVCKILGYDIGKDVLTKQLCYIGEPTTNLIKKSTLTHRELGWGRDEGEYIIIDFPRWLDLLSRGNMIEFPVALSAFRRHSGQDTVQNDTPLRTHICWLINIRHAIRNLIFLDDLESQKTALMYWLRKALELEAAYKAKGYSSVMLARLIELIPVVYGAMKTDCQLDIDEIIFPKENLA